MAANVALGHLLDSDPNHRGGRPFIASTRLSVDRIAVMHAWGWSTERMAYEHDVEMWQVYAGLAFYLANRDVIDRDIAAWDEEAERFVSALKQGVNPGQDELDDFFPVARHAPAYPSSLLSLREGIDEDRVTALFADELGPSRIAKDLGLDLAQVYAVLAYALTDRPVATAQLREDPAAYSSDGEATDGAPHSG